MFNAADYKKLHSIVFQDNYPGYKPNVIEAPNGDGYWDNDKRYAHIAAKYLTDLPYTPTKTVLQDYLSRATQYAVSVAISLGVPKEFWPTYQYSAIRLLEYPPGAVTNPHTDFDLFTLMLYRNIPETFQYIQQDLVKIGYDALLKEAQGFNSQIHFGEILEIVNPSYQATPHEVVPDIHGRTQYSMVYFAIPDHAAVLPTGETVGAWIEERISRSRKTVEEKV
jgi:isopenicillin N synthase-like dioxygenase